MSSKKKIVWVLQGKTEHQAFLLKEDGEESFVEWSSTQQAEWVDSALVRLELPPRCRDASTRDDNQRVPEASREHSNATKRSGSCDAKNMPRKKKLQQSKSGKEQQQEDAKPESSNASRSSVTFEEVLQQARNNVPSDAAEGSIKACIVFPNNKNYESFESAFVANDWQVAMQEAENVDENGNPEPRDLWMLGTNSKDKIRGVYEHAWRDTGDEKTFFSGENPWQNLWICKNAKGDIENHVLQAEYHSIYKYIVLSPCSQGSGFRLTEGLVEFLERKLDTWKATLIAPSKSTVLSTKNSTKKEPSLKVFLDSLLSLMALSVRIGIVDTRDFNREVWAGAAILETDASGKESILAYDAIRFSRKGQGETHAEERVLAELHSKRKKAERTQGSSMHMALIVVHAMGGGQGGSMCGSCICALSQFHADWCLDPGKLAVVYPTRRFKRHERPEKGEWVSPRTAFYDMVKDKKNHFNLLQDIVYHNSKMNNHGTSGCIGEDVIGHDVSTVVQSLHDNSLHDDDATNHASHWKHCCYHGTNEKHDFRLPS